MRGVPGKEFSPQDAQNLKAAVGLYRGDLLPGCYEDWCLFERERLQNAYLDVLDKLMDYCEAHQQYEAGLTYGSAALRLERARERTHRRVMRLAWRAGNRSAALRQYERCVIALREELEVEPSRSTVALYQHIRTGQLDGTTAWSLGEVSQKGSAPVLRLAEMLTFFKALREVLADLHCQVEEEIASIGASVKGQT